MKELFLLDAAGYLYRSYFAIQNMTNNQGESTNALFGFIRSFLKLVKDFKLTHCVVVFDGFKNAEKRSLLYPDYKAHRKAMPPDLLYQMEWAKKFCEFYGVSYLSITGVEADDTIASIANWVLKETDVFICTSDKDLSQIVNDHIFILDTYKDNLIIKKQEVEKKFGIPPELIADFLAITGDASDNIPGIPGIGPKGACELLKSFGSLDKILQNISLIPGKKKQELFLTYKEQVLLSKQLVTLDFSVAFPKELDFFALKAPQEKLLREFYVEMKFNSLIREFEEHKTVTVNENKAITTNFQIIEDEKSLQEMVNFLKTQQEIALSTEGNYLSALEKTLVGISLGITLDKIWYIPFNHLLEKDVLIKYLKILFEDPKIFFYGHNIKYDYHLLKKVDLHLERISFDINLASYLLNISVKHHLLEELVLEIFGVLKLTKDKLLGKGKEAIAFKALSIKTAAEFCSEELGYTLVLKNHLEKQLQEKNFQKLYYQLELPILKILAEMESAGIYLDPAILKQSGLRLEAELDILKKQIYEIAEEEFNINSPKQLGEILFKKLKIPSPKGSSTGAEVLEYLKKDYPIAKLLQEYRGLEKLRSTYVETLATEINPMTLRIHCTFNQTVTATGRLSCQEPNLQNIPIRSKEGLKIREAFRPEKLEWSFLSADYSQIELRILAHLSEDINLLTAFEQDQDIHTYTASRVFHIPLNEVTKEQRARAKAVNFGIIYGQGAYGLAQTINICQKEAAEFINLYFKQYPKVKLFLENCKEAARLTGKAVTLMGRERVIPNLHSRNMQIRGMAERFAINAPFQGTAADIIKVAMINIQKAIKHLSLQGYMILQIHDELIFEVPDSELAIFQKLVKTEMENAFVLKVPLIVDISVGKNWKEC